MKQGKNTPAGMATGNRVHSTGKLKMKDSKQHTFAVQWRSVWSLLFNAQLRKGLSGDGKKFEDTEMK